MPSLTASGGLITDLMRARGAGVNVQGDSYDGVTGDSSFGIWPGTTNWSTNGGAETDASTATAENSSGSGCTIAQDATQFKFGSKSFKCVTTGNDVNQGAAFGGYGNGVVAVSQRWAASMWVFHQAAGARNFKAAIYERTAADASLTKNYSSSVSVAPNVWTRISFTFTTTSATVAQLRAAAVLPDATALSFWVDGVQLEEDFSVGPIPTPYVHTDGSAQSRQNAAVQGLPSIPHPEQGWMAARVRMGFSSSTAATCYVFSWGPDSSNRISLGLVGGALNPYQISSVYLGSGDTTTLGSAFSSGDLVTLVMSWTRNQISLSINGAAFSSISRTLIPVTSSWPGFVAGATYSGGAFANQLSGSMLWFALGSGVITAADASALNALGNTDPTLASFRDDNAASIVWSADTVTYTVPFISPGPEFKEPEPITIKLDRPGRTPLDLSVDTNNLVWGTAAMGGFADCSFQMEGDRRRDVNYLSMLRVWYGETLAWEGRIEDMQLQLGEGGHWTTSFTAFGLKRLLDWTSIKRAWISRSLTGTTPASNAVGTSSGNTLKIAAGSWNVKVGKFTSVTGTNSLGVYFAGVGSSPVQAFQTPHTWPSNYQSHAVEMITPGPDGVVYLTLKFDVAIVAAASGSHGLILASADGGTSWTQVGGPYTATASGNSISLPASTTRLRFAVANSSTTPINTSNDEIYFNNIRFQAAVSTDPVVPATEDTSGGFYGGTILRDLIGLVPGLKVGTIETGSEYGIQHVDASVRRSASSVVAEVVAFYPNREWAVWEDGRFDWRTHSVDQPLWTFRLEDVLTLSLTGSLDPLARTVYVVSSDPSSQSTVTTPPAITSGGVVSTGGVTEGGKTTAAVPQAGVTSGDVVESSSVSTDQRNPFVRTGITKDVIVSVQAKTTADAAQIASKLSGDQSTYTPISGSISLLFSRLVRTQSGLRQAAFIRGGDTVVIPDLPKLGDPFAIGRDGETYFHVVSTEANLENQTITLTIEGQMRSSESILARISAAN